jgi:DNA-binding MarR family transcriptional regulator
MIAVTASFPELSSQDCLVLRARRAARAITDLYDLVLSPTGLRITQFILLRAILEHGRVCQQQLVAELAVSPETISRRMAALVSAGWARLIPGQHGRQKSYRVTEMGKAEFLRALPFWRLSQNRLRLCLGEGDCQAAMRVLDMLVQKAQQAEAARIRNVLNF